MTIDTTAYATAYDETQTQLSYGDNVTTTDYAGDGQNASAAIDVLDTPSCSLPPATPDMHEATIVNVETKTFDSGTVGIFANLVSKNTGQEFTKKIWPPQDFFDAANWSNGQFNADVLSETPAPGKSQSPRVRFAKTIASTEGKKSAEVNGQEAELQILIKLAKLDGRTIDPGTAAATDGESYVAIVNQLVSGLEVLVTRTPEKNGDNAGRLQVNRILSKDKLNDPKFDKLYPRFSEITGKGYRRAFETY
jgi:hypothetical protein